MNLFDLLPPFAIGDRIQATPASTFYTAGRTWTVTAITDEGHQWRVDASQGKPGQSPGITTRWAKDEPPKMVAAA